MVLVGGSTFTSKAAYIALQSTFIWQYPEDAGLRVAIHLTIHD